LMRIRDLGWKKVGSGIRDDTDDMSHTSLQYYLML
jgi:hypothetical protein